MSYLDRLKKLDKPLPESLTKPTKAPSVSIVSRTGRRTSKKTDPVETDRLEKFRDHVWRELEAHPDKVKYFEVLDRDADPVRLVLAIRDVGTCDLLIDRDRWDPLRFLELLDVKADLLQ